MPSRAGARPDNPDRGRGGGGRGRRWRLVRAGRDAVPASVRRFTARARRNRLRAANRWLSAAAVAAIVGLLGVLVFATPVLGVAEVRVSGAHLISVDEVRAVAGIRPGTPLARVDVRGVRRRVEALGPVRRADVHRRWPRSMVITVTERTAAAVVARDGGFLLLDATGVGYAAQASRPAGLPLLRLGDPGPDDASTRAALAVLAALTPQLRDRLVALIVEAPTRVRLELAGDRVVVWGDATANDAKARVATVLLDRPGKLIDVSSPDVVTVR
jgi:cell division protein FtsQ